MTVATAESLGIPEIFNVATYFVDRNVTIGRGTNVAIECGDVRITYDEVQRNVNRCGNALRRLGVRPEERVLLLLYDGPEFVYSFFGAIKIGAVPVPLNTLWKAADYQYVIRDSRASALIVSAALLPVIQSIPPADRPSLRHIIVTSAPDPRRSASRRTPTPSSACCSRRAPASSRPSRRSRDAPAFWLYSSGSTGKPKGCVHLHHDMVDLRRAVRQRRARHPRDRPVLQRRQAVLRVRPGQRADLSVLGGRDGDPVAGRAGAAERLRGHRGASADAVLLRADRLRDAAGSRHGAEGAGFRSLVDPPRRLGRRSAAGRAVRALQGAVRRRHHRRHRLDRSAAHVHLEPARRDPARFERPAGARLRGAPARRERPADAARRDRQPVDLRRFGLRRVLEPAREDQGHDRRALDPHRRQVHAGRRRLLLVRGPGRRHAQGRRPVGQPGRGRERARRAHRRCSSAAWSAARITTAW